LAVAQIIPAGPRPLPEPDSTRRAKVWVMHAGRIAIYWSLETIVMMVYKME